MWDHRYWKHEKSSPASLSGSVKSVPESSVPLGLVRSCGFARPQQLSFIHRFLFCPLVPAYVTDPDEGGLVLQQVLLSARGFNWWAAVTSQYRLQKLISFCKKNQVDHPRPSTDTWHKDLLKHVASMYALGFFSKISLGKKTSFTTSSEISGSENQGSSKAVLQHKFQSHDLSLEASWNEQYVHVEGPSWVVPLSLSLNLASNRSSDGPWYHLGIQHNSGISGESDNTQKVIAPAALSPGLRGRATVCKEYQYDIWKSRPNIERKPYNLLNVRPHITFSSLFGGTLNALVENNMSFTQVRKMLFKNQSCQGSELQRPRLSADLFSSVGCSVQFGRFQRLLFDLTKLDTRVEFNMSKESGSTTANWSDDSSALHRHNKYPIDSSVVFMLQQQIVGPLCARVDTRLSGDDFSRGNIKAKEIIYGLDYSLPTIGSGKVLAWYSPTQKQGMVEIRFFEE